MRDNWVVSTLENALSNWNEHLSEIWSLVSQTLESFAGEATARTGQTFLRSYVGVCMEGAVIVLACVIYSAFLSGGSTALDESLPAVTMVWQYIGQLMFNMLVLTGLVKGASRLVREMMG